MRLAKLAAVRWAVLSIISCMEKLPAPKLADLSRKGNPSNCTKAGCTCADIRPYGTSARPTLRYILRASNWERPDCRAATDHITLDSNILYTQTYGSFGACCSSSSKTVNS